MDEDSSMVASAMAPARMTLAPPPGMRDLLFPQSWRRRELLQRLVEYFGRFGYEFTLTPPFELAEVIEPGLTSLDPRELLRFVEPESGEVALLRPDITPQIARIVATLLRERPAPWRLSYEGTVVRRRFGRARRQRQIAQAGVECIGLAGIEADAEVMQLALGACEAVGLSQLRLELGHVRFADGALQALPESLRSAAAEALARKDLHRLDALSEPLTKDQRQHLRALPRLFGGLDTLEQARRHLQNEVQERALDELAQIVEKLRSLDLESRLDIDLGELRGRAYYTGVNFQLLAEGPGEALGAGGRYDQLLGRFAFPQPAIGFALDVENLEWALAKGNAAARPPWTPRLAVYAASKAAAPSLSSWLDFLRGEGFRAARLTSGRSAEEAMAFARAWGYDALVRVEAQQLELRWVRQPENARRFESERDASRPELAAALREESPRAE